MPTQTPSLSIIVVAYNMPEQAMNTLCSLSSTYQRGVSRDDYEVLVMENASGNDLCPKAVAQLGSNFHYHLRDEPGVSPAPAINEAISRSRGNSIGLLIDGARMLTPGVIYYALQALACPNAVVTVPGYYLTEQGKTELGSSELEATAILDYEKRILHESGWGSDGYQLFRHACFSNGNRHGYLEPMMECNALFCHRDLLAQCGGANERFALKGGGALNLHMYRQLATANDTLLTTLPGEGNFHQFHGGTSTTPGGERDALVKTFKAQLDEFWPGGFRAVRREPSLLGKVSQDALPFLEASVKSSQVRLERFRRDKQDPWQDELET